MLIREAPLTLCHPVAFLNGVTPGIFFLFDRKRFVSNLRYLMAVYFGAVALMAFWLVPLMVKIGYATSINWTWNFNSWSEILPRVLQPVAAMAAATTLASIVLPRPDNRAARKELGGSAAKKEPEGSIWKKDFGSIAKNAPCTFGFCSSVTSTFLSAGFIERISKSATSPASVSRTRVPPELRRSGDRGPTAAPRGRHVGSFASPGK